MRSQVDLQFSSVQSLSCVRLFATPWITARQASLSITNSQSPPKPMSIVSVMPSNHLILCHPLLLLPSIFPSIRVFSNESALRIRWPKCWSFWFTTNQKYTTDWQKSNRRELKHNIKENHQIAKERQKSTEKHCFDLFRCWNPPKTRRISSFYVAF